MNKDAYMECLKKKLKRLPKEDYDIAIEYFEEYFAEAGKENEQQAINDLGTPETAANQILMNMAIRNVKEVNQSVKRGLSTVWIGVLAIFAAPIGLPIAFALVCTVGALLLAALLLVGAFFLTAVTVVIASIIGIVAGGILIFLSPANGIATVGFGFCCLGIGILVVYGSILVCQGLLRGITKWFGRICERRNLYEK